MRVIGSEMYTLRKVVAIVCITPTGSVWRRGVRR